MEAKLESYINLILNNRIDKFNTLHNLILKHYPNAVVDMKYKMPTYHVDQGWVALANQKNYISLYTCLPEALDVFKKTHPKINTGKGCINFKETNELPLEDIEQVIKLAMER